MREVFLLKAIPLRSKHPLQNESRRLHLLMKRNDRVIP
jgi:hypothetical protein